MQPHDTPNGGQARAGLGGALFACRALATTVEVFLHEGGTFGERYIGAQAVAGVVLLIVFPAFCPGGDDETLLAFLCLYVLGCVGVRGRAVKRRSRGGSQPHSYYSGSPWVMRLSRRLSERTAKAVVEPALVWLLGALMAEVDRTLGGFLLLAGFGLLISVHASLALERTRILDMHDALIQQRDVAERFRRLRGE
ncbi:MAG: hypothetical protein GC161_06840 [Planctomycetaceae bacterium]|nr:hypothetical protein [Planctomycetaceae bacterium]